MKTVLIIFLLEFYSAKGTVISAAYSTGDAFSCFDQSATDITLTCTVANTLVGSVVWSRDTTAMTTCSFTVDNTCLPSPGFSEPRYSFTSDVGQKKFYLTITSVSSSSDFVSFTCEHGIGDDGSFSVRECVACTVETVANGQVNTTSTTVVEGTVVVLTCNAGYTLQGSSELTCQADQTWDNPFPTCKASTTPSPSITTPPESPGLDWWIILIIVLVIVAVLSAIVLAVFCWLSKRKPFPPRNLTCADTKRLSWDPPQTYFIVPDVNKYCIYTLNYEQEWKKVGNVEARLTEYNLQHPTDWQEMTVAVRGENKNDLGDPAIIEIASGVVRNLPESHYKMLWPTESGEELRVTNSVNQGQDPKPSEGPRPLPAGGNTAKLTTESQPQPTNSEAGSFVSGKDVQLQPVQHTGKSNWRPQPALPGIQGDNRAIRGLSANIEDQDMYLDKKNRLTPIGQEAKNYYEEEAVEDIQVKKKKTKKKKREKVETDDIQD